MTYLGCWLAFIQNLQSATTSTGPIWLSRADLENATSFASVIACFDDNNVGTALPAAVSQIIDRAEQEVLSWLVDEFGPPPFAASTLTQLAGDHFLKYCALEYAVALMVDRRPEYFLSNRDDIKARMARADARMERVLQSRQRPPTVTKPPANVGGVSVDNAARIMVDSPDGTYNGGDYIEFAIGSTEAWNR